MKLQLKCDDCGRIGSPEEISTDFDGVDLCKPCGLKAMLISLRNDHARKKEWLETTYVKELQRLEKQIADTEMELATYLWF